MFQSDGRDANLWVRVTDLNGIDLNLIFKSIQKDIPAANSPSNRDAVHRLSGNSFWYYWKIIYKIKI